MGFLNTGVQTHTKIDFRPTVVEKTDVVRLAETFYPRKHTKKEEPRKMFLLNGSFPFQFHNITTGRSRCRFTNKTREFGLHFCNNGHELPLSHVSVESTVRHL